MRKFFYDLKRIVFRFPVHDDMFNQRIILLPDGLHRISDRGRAVEGGCYDGDFEGHLVGSWQLAVGS